MVFADWSTQPHADSCRSMSAQVSWRSSTVGWNLMAEPWTSVEELAKHLGVAKDSIYRWIEHRSLPGHRIGRLWKFKVSEVDEWVRARGADPGFREKGDKR